MTKSLLGNESLRSRVKKEKSALRLLQLRLQLNLHLYSFGMGSFCICQIRIQTTGSMGGITRFVKSNMSFKPKSPRINRGLWIHSL